MLTDLIPIALLAVLGLALVGWSYGQMLKRAPTDDPEQAMMYALGRLYARWFHGVRVDGREHLDALADRPPDRPVILVANHTAGVDPILIASQTPVAVRWLMAEDMRVPALQWFWDWFGVIFVARADRRGVGMRDALRELRSNGVLGIFPEGAIERPARQVLPFQPGVGLLILKSNAIVVPVIVEDTPQVDPAWASLWSPSKSRLRCLPWWSVPEGMTDPADVAGALQDLFIEATGWSVNPTPSTVQVDASKQRVAA